MYDKGQQYASLLRYGHGLAIAYPYVEATAQNVDPEWWELGARAYAALYDITYPVMDVAA